MAKRKECKFCGKKGVESGECGLCRKEANQTYVEYWKRMPLNISARILQTKQISRILAIILLCVIVRIFPDIVVLADENMQRSIYPHDKVLNIKSLNEGDRGEMKEAKKGFVFVRNYEKSDN